MSLATMRTQPVVIEHWADTDEIDRYGNPVRVKTGEVDELAYLEQGGGESQAKEVQVDRDTFVTDWILVLRAGAVISGRDRVRYRGATYEVIGDPAPRWNPRRRADHHIAARIRVSVG